jgi:hypothetical protein
MMMHALGYAFVMTSMPSKRNMICPMETTYIILAYKDYGEAVKTVVIALPLGGGLVRALIGANKAMVKTLAGEKDAQEEEDPKNIKPGESFDPTLMETRYRRYVEDSGASGPSFPFNSVLLASQRTPLADIVAILGRIGDVNALADRSNLPSTKMPNVSLTEPPMWLDSFIHSFVVERDLEAAGVVVEISPWMETTFVVVVEWIFQMPESCFEPFGRF